MKYIDAWREELLEVPEPTNELILFEEFNKAVITCQLFYINIYGHGNNTTMLQEILPVTIVTCINRFRIRADEYFIHPNLGAIITKHVKSAILKWYRSKGVVSLSEWDVTNLKHRLKPDDVMSLDFEDFADKPPPELIDWDESRLSREIKRDVMLYIKCFEPDYYKAIQMGIGVNRGLLTNYMKVTGKKMTSAVKSMKQIRTNLKQYVLGGN